MEAPTRAPGLDFVLGRNEWLVQRLHREIAERIGVPLRQAIGEPSLR